MTTENFDFHLLLHSAALVEERLRQRLGAVDLLPRQARVIDALDRLGHASQVELARQFGVTPASISTMTTRLIAAQYISRQVDPNEARSNILSLTPKGHELLDEIHAAWAEMDALLVEKLGVQKTAALSEVTRDLRDALGGQGPARRAAVKSK